MPTPLPTYIGFSRPFGLRSLQRTDDDQYEVRAWNPIDEIESTFPVTVDQAFRICRWAHGNRAIQSGVNGGDGGHCDVR